MRKSFTCLLAAGLILAAMPTAAMADQPTTIGSTASATAQQACSKALNDKVKLPVGLTGDQLCPLISVALAPAELPSVGVSNRIEYTETPEFYAALAKSLKEFGKQGKPLQVYWGDHSPALPVNKLITLQPPTYKQVGLNIWLTHIEDSGGKTCQKSGQQAAILALVAPLLFDLLKPVVSGLIMKYKAAQLLKPAKYYDGVVVADESGQQAGYIRSVYFLPRGQITGECKALNKEIKVQ